MRLVYFAAIPCLALGAFAAQRVFTSYARARPVLEQYAAELPPELKKPDQASWNAWSHKQDRAIRDRLQQGDLDSMVNLLLFGTSFTKQPRVKVEAIVEASRSGVLRARVDDLIHALAQPGTNERLAYLAGLLRSRGIDPASASPDTGVFVYDNVRRVLEERQKLLQRVEQADGAGKTSAPDAAVALRERSGLYSDRGVSLDTSIFPNFAIDYALRELKSRGELREGQIEKVAVIGPGLDVIDKNDEFAYDYYPQQTVQPFALIDSLLRFGLAKPGAASEAVFDISSKVIDHLQRARERARKQEGYAIQLPRAAGVPWPADLLAYWRSLGDQVGAPDAPIRPPEIFRGLETRAVRVRPEVVLACEPLDLNIVLERLDLAPQDGFDLVVGTNVFIYYSAFEQTLALENMAAMLKPGGILLTNDRLPELKGGSLRQAGLFDVRAGGGDAIRDTVVWYRKRSTPPSH